MQIQFNVKEQGQDFNGSVEEWAKLYLKYFISSATERRESMIRKFIKPFEKYI